MTVLDRLCNWSLNADVPKCIQGPQGYEDFLLIRTVDAHEESAGRGSFAGQLRRSFSGIIYIENTTASQPIKYPQPTYHNLRFEYSFFRRVQDDYLNLKRLEDAYLEEHRHDNPQLQHEYDKRFGLVPL